MNGAPILVLDASVGVKWFRDEEGSAEARQLLGDQRESNVMLHAPAHFAVEVLSVVNRSFGSAAIISAGELLVLSGIEFHSLTPEVVGEAARQCVLLGCSFYDALAPALAVLLGGELCSADRRAHEAFAGVRLLGG